MNGNELKLWIASLTICNFNTVQSNRWILIVTNIAQFLLLLKRTPFIKRTLEKEVSLYFECYATMPMFADARSYFELWLPSCDQFTIKYNPRLLFISEYTEVTYFDRPHVMFINKNGNTSRCLCYWLQLKKVMNIWNVVIEVGGMLRKLRLSRLYVASATQRNATHSAWQNALSVISSALHETFVRIKHFHSVSKFLLYWMRIFCCIYKVFLRPQKAFA